MAEVYGSYAEAKQIIEETELRNGVRFVLVARTKDCRLTRLESLHNWRVHFEDNRGDIPIRYDGVPFVIVGTEYLECQYGRQRKKKNKPKAVLEVLEGSDTKQKRLEVKRQLKGNLSETDIQEYRVHLKFSNDHAGHAVGENSDFGQPLDKRITRKIRKLVLEDGITVASDIKRVLEEFKKNLPASSKSNRRFNPSLQDIQGHIAAALKSERCSTDDFKNLHSLVQQWFEKSPNDKFLLQPISSGSDGGHPFLFVHQTEFQQRLLKKYGNEIVLMDSTYNTSKYSLPLFFLAVLTNCGYFVVGTFIVQHENTQEITDALRVFRKWNTNWNPQGFMCDLDQREISAIENCFGCMVYSCSFHREQSWKRWLQKNKHNAAKDKEEILHDLRQIACSYTEEQMNINIDTMRSKPYYINNQLFSNWIEQYWLANKKSIEELNQHLNNEWMFYMRDPKCPVVGLRITMLKNLPKHTDLYKFLATEKLMAIQYITHVLLKEVLAFLLCKRFNMSYNEADAKCRETEVDVTQVIRGNKKRQ